MTQITINLPVNGETLEKPPMSKEEYEALCDAALEGYGFHAWRQRSLM